jgi:hypothetical protein
LPIKDWQKDGVVVRTGVESKHKIAPFEDGVIFRMRFVGANFVRPQKGPRSVVAVTGSADFSPLWRGVGEADGVVPQGAESPQNVAVMKKHNRAKLFEIMD